MKISLDASKTAQENAAEYYSKASKLRAKASGAKKALEETLHLLAREEKREQYKKPEEAVAKRKFRMTRELEWYEKYHWFYTSGGLLVVAGRDASQNEQVFARYAQPGDMFFHADVHGAPATILKEGNTVKATEQDKLEVAQFAVSYSSSWKNGFGSADVYCVPVENVSRHAKAGEYVAKGGFIISGKREYFRNTPLGLTIGMDEKKRVVAQPSVSKRALENAVSILPAGTKEKGVASKEIMARLGTDNLDEILLVVPAGKTEVVRQASARAKTQAKGQAE
jgi:predicted ribosome quality control (RQC) complex YloA/Tae2 family protein